MADFKKITVIENGVEISRVLQLTPAEQAQHDAPPEPRPPQSDEIEDVIRSMAALLGPQHVALVKSKLGPVRPARVKPDRRP